MAVDELAGEGVVGKLRGRDRQDQARRRSEPGAEARAERCPGEVGGARGRGGQCRLDPVAESGRRRIAERGILHRAAQQPELLIGSGAADAIFEMRLASGGIGRVELVIEQGVQQHVPVGTGGHRESSRRSGGVSPADGSSNLVSISRARARRDMTVPIGTPVSVAISR